MSRLMSPEVARDLQERSARVKRTTHLIRTAEAWVDQDAPLIHEMPAYQERVIRTLLRAAEQAEGPEREPGFHGADPDGRRA